MTHLFQQKTTLSLSTCDKNGGLWTSSAPFAVKEDKAYLFMSATAEHYANLKENKKLSFMVAEEGEKAKNPFVLESVTFQSEATELKTIPEDVWAMFRSRFPVEMLEQLRKLNFHMFELSLGKGTYMSDFGKAYTVFFQDGTWKQEAVVDTTMRLG